MTSILVVGCGNIGNALIKGILGHKSADTKLYAFDIHKSKLKNLCASGEVQAFDKALGKKASGKKASGIIVDIVFLCVKPFDLDSSCAWLKEHLNEKSVVVSILAGVKSESVKAALDDKCSVIRAMPNICANIGSSATVVCTNNAVERSKMDVAIELLETIGTVCELKEELMDGVTGLSGSGPAYVFLIVEALIDAGVKVGIPRGTARDLVLQTIKGSVDLVLSSMLHPAALKDQVTTPGGTTIHAVHDLESNGLRSVLMDAVVTATNQSKKLGLQ